MKEKRITFHPKKTRRQERAMERRLATYIVGEHSGRTPEQVEAMRKPVLR